MDTGYDTGLPPQSPLALANLEAISHLLKLLLCTHGNSKRVPARCLSLLHILSRANAGGPPET